MIPQNIEEMNQLELDQYWNKVKQHEKQISAKLKKKWINLKQSKTSRLHQCPDAGGGAHWVELLHREKHCCPHFLRTKRER